MSITVVEKFLGKLKFWGEGKGIVFILSYWFSLNPILYLEVLSLRTHVLESDKCDSNLVSHALQL